MFSWFKKEKKCQHYKGAGDKVIRTMKTVIRFYGQDGDSYGVAQCELCGKRAFQCLFYHAMSNQMSELVDKFIDYKITIEQFKNQMKNWNVKYKEKTNNTAQEEV